MPSSVRARLRAAKLELLDLKIELQGMIESTEKDLDSIWMELGKKETESINFAAVRELRGHYGKVCALAWCKSEEKSHLIASVGQDAKLLLWDAKNQCRVAAVSLEYAWVLSGAAADDGSLICSGGLDNAVTIYKSPDYTSEKPSGIITEPSQKLKGHDGYVSDCKFLPQGQMLTGSGDATCALWDLESGTMVHQFEEHGADVQATSLNPQNTNVFVSASCDSLIRVFDLRDASKAGTVIRGHEGDVNDVCVAECGNIICSASNDSTCRMNDMRICRPISVFSSSKLSGVACNSVAISKSGSILFSGHEDASLVAWETTSAQL